MNQRMFTVGKKRESIQIKVDVRDISRIYYIQNNKMFIAKLNERISGNSEFGSLTLKQWEDYRKTLGKMKAEGRLYNEALMSYRYAVNDLIVKSAKQENSSKQEEIRIARGLEKQITSEKNKVINRLYDTVESMKQTEAKAIEEKQENVMEEATEQTEELSDYEKRIREIQKKPVYLLTDEDASLLTQYAMEHFYDDM